MIIAIPSKSRPHFKKSAEYITRAITFVPELEIDAYRRAGHKNVIPVPNDVRGITNTRNFILDYAADLNERYVVMIDDDLKVVGWMELYSHNAKHFRLTENEMIGEWSKLFDLTDGLGYHLWGLSTDGALRSVYPYKPFIFRTYVTASCCGLINEPNIRFDPSYPVKEDYELTLRLIRDDGGIVGARYLYWVNEHWKEPGGCRDYRTQEMERDAIYRLMREYPGYIRRVRRGGSSYSIELDF